MPDRRAFLEACAALGLGGTLFPGALYAEAARDAVAGAAPDGMPAPPPTVGPDDITAAHIAAAETLAGLSFTDEERALMLEGLRDNLRGYAAVRALDLPNSRRPAEVFEPTLGGAAVPAGDAGPTWAPPEGVTRPARDEDLAFASVAELAALLRAGAVTSVELTTFFLARLRRLDPQLKAVVTYTEARALEAARRADAELAAGRPRGPLHGIPYGAKDLLAVEGYPTTWGATPYQDQTLDDTAAVVDKLDAAGAVLVAKLALGALAWGDVWFGGTTKNPWNLDQGASGSSAGPGAAVAAGGVPFAIGSETLGSIVSPSTRNGVTGHRPTFGAVSRHGAMTLSWTMDKLGPMARSAEDAALVFDAIRGPDPRDPTTRAFPFPFDPAFDVTRLRVGVLQDAFEGGDYANQVADQATLDVVRGLGVELVPLRLPTDLPVGALLTTLSVEAAAAFDTLTRERGIDTMVRQGENTWPNTFRTARFVPAVEHVQARRARTRLMEATHAAMADVDVVLSPSFSGGTLAITNLTGHPCVCFPNAFRPLEDAPAASPRREPGSITVVAQLYHDHHALALAHAVQQATDFHRQRPPVE